MKELDKVSNRALDNDFVSFFDNTPVIMAPEQRTKAVFGAVKLWTELFPEEVEPAMKQCRAVSDMLRASMNHKSKTKEGERVLGMIPEQVNQILIQAFNDSNYLWNNPGVIGDLFEAFAIGRFDQSPGRVTLNSADRE